MLTAAGSTTGDSNCSVAPCAQNHESAFWPVNKGKLAGRPVDNYIEIPAPTQRLAPELALFAVQTSFDCGEQRAEAAIDAVPTEATPYA
jgi:hypothetical protein